MNRIEIEDAVSALLLQRMGEVRTTAQDQLNLALAYQALQSAIIERRAAEESTAPESMPDGPDEAEWGDQFPKSRWS